MRFLVDAQLPPALAKLMTAGGHEATHVGDCGLQAAPDGAIRDFAAMHGWSIVTKDQDFAQRRALADTGPSVIWIRLPNTRRRHLLAWFETALQDIVAALESGEVLIEVT